MLKRADADDLALAVAARGHDAADKVARRVDVCGDGNAVNERSGLAVDFDAIVDHRLHIEAIEPVNARTLDAVAVLILLAGAHHMVMRLSRVFDCIFGFAKTALGQGADETDNCDFVHNQKHPNTTLPYWGLLWGVLCAQ